MVKKLEAKKMGLILFNLCMNEEFTTQDNIISSDINWIDVIYHIPRGVLSFRINAISNALSSPTNLRKWCFKSHGRCPLCNNRWATGANILSNCYIALIQDRYTWTHNNVLKSIHKYIVSIVCTANRDNATTRAKKKNQKRLKNL